jgi:chitin-binding protein
MRAPAAGADGASHGADYIRVYVTKPGFDPVTTALKWSDLELVSHIGDTPAARRTSVSGGVQIDLPVALSGRSGRAMVYTIWQASHLDQSYYFCSDVAFGGTSTPPASTPPASTPPVTTSPTVSPTATTPAPTGDCSATYAVASSWQGGYQGEVRVTAGPAAIKGFGFIGSGASSVPTATCRATV